MKGLVLWLDSSTMQPSLLPQLAISAVSALPSYVLPLSVNPAYLPQFGSFPVPSSHIFLPFSGLANYSMFGFKEKPQGGFCRHVANRVLQADPGPAALGSRIFSTWEKLLPVFRLCAFGQQVIEPSKRKKKKSSDTLTVKANSEFARQMTPQRLR